MFDVLQSGPFQRNGPCPDKLPGVFSLVLASGAREHLGWTLREAGRVDATKHRFYSVLV